MANEVVILGHKAKIEHVFGKAKDDFLQREDQLVVWIRFDVPVENTVSLSVSFPAKKYERDEFLYIVRCRGEQELDRILARNERERRERDAKDKRTATVEALAAEAWKLIE